MRSSILVALASVFLAASAAPQGQISSAGTSTITVDIHSTGSTAVFTVTNSAAISASNSALSAGRSAASSIAASGGNTATISQDISPRPSGTYNGAPSQMKTGSMGAAGWVVGAAVVAVGAAMI